jgi:hypothetical protein
MQSDDFFRKKNILDEYSDQEQGLKIRDKYIVINDDRLLDEQSKEKINIDIEEKCFFSYIRRKV